MKHFYILKDEFIINKAHAFKANYNGENMFFIYDEKQLKNAIQQNKINLYRTLPAFRDGDVVLLRDTPGIIWVPDMECYLGNKVIVKNVNTDGSFSFKNDGGWNFFVDSVAEVISNQ